MTRQQSASYMSVTSPKNKKNKKHRMEAPSALLIEEELALARHKRREKARLKVMHLDEEAGIVFVKAKTIDKGLDLSGALTHSEPFHLPNLLSEILKNAYRNI